MHLAVVRDFFSFFFYIMTDQDIKDILDIEVEEPPITPQLSKEAIMGTLKVNPGLVLFN